MNCLGTSEYKIILLGEVGVGKTTFFLRIRDGEFVDTSTVGRSTAMRMRLHVQPQLSYSLKLKDGVEVKTVLNDTANAERFRTFTTSYYREVDAAILMYSVDDSYTFECLQSWIEEANEYCARSKKFVWAVIGNKSDLQLEVEMDRVRQLCEHVNTKLCFYTSAKTGENVISAFEEIIREIHKRHSGDRRSSMGSIQLKTSSNSVSCCQ